MAAIAADDARHSVLSKARALSQSSLEAFLEQRAALSGAASALLPPSEYGRYDVREVDVKSALTKCAMPGEPWSLNPYTGCSHDCAYCYVPDVAHVERKKWGSYVIVKRNLPTVLSHELSRKERRPVLMSSATDPYQPAESRHLVTRRCLEQLRRVDWPLSVLTRSPLVRRDFGLLAQFSELDIGMSVPTLDDEARRIVEPGAPPIEGRLRTLRAMADEGFAPFVNLAPLFPLTGQKPAEVAAAFAEAGVRVACASAWRYLGSVLPHLRERTDGTVYEHFARAVKDPRYYDRLFRQLRVAFREAGVEFVVMRIGTRPADGA